MSIFGWLSSTPEQEEVSNAYQEWRDENPDNPSDDDFYFDSGAEDAPNNNDLDSFDFDSDATDDNDDSDRAGESWTGWFGLW